MEKPRIPGPHTPRAARIVTVPNVISVVRLALVPAFVWLFVSGRENAAVVVYGVGATSDFLDGYIARRTGAVTNLGKILDPLADRIFIVALCVALVARDTLPIALAVAVVARDVLLLSLWPLLERRGVESIPVNFTGKTATALLLFGLTWLALSETTFGWASIGRAVGLPCVIVGAGLYWAAAALYGREALVRIRTLRSGPLP